MLESAPTPREETDGADARAPSTPRAVLRHGTAPDDDVSRLVERLVHAIEEMATSVAWSERVKLAPGFAEEGVRLVIATWIALRRPRI